VEAPSERLLVVWTRQQPGPIPLEEGGTLQANWGLYIFSDRHPYIYVYRNPTTFRIFSPDELASNKLDTLLEDSGRNFQWDIASRDKGGRVIEILSEHTCQGMLQGYTLTGGTGLLPSCEAFFGIVHTMMVQYGKFVKTVCPGLFRRVLSIF
jgi:xylulose-5-phosphate/fructose-6-phosphate phosphoketolase